MVQEASVRLSVDNAQALTENQKFLRGVQDSFSRLKQDSEAYNTTLQDRIKYMERELELRRLQARSSYEDAITSINNRDIKTEDKRILRSEVREGYREDISELKELNKFVKQYSNEEKQRDRESQKMLQTFTGSLTRVIGSGDASSLIQSTGSSTIGSGLGRAGIVGLALAAVGGAVVGQQMKGAVAMERVMGDYALLTGQTMFDTRDDVKRMSEGGRLSRLGMTPSEYFSQYSQYLRASGGTMRGSGLDIVAAAGATGVSQSQMSTLLGLQRYDNGQALPLLSYMERHLKDTSQSIAILPEILQTFTQEANIMLATTGRVDSETIATAVTALSNAFNLRGQPLQTITGAFRQGLQQSSDPVIQAIQFDAMGRSMKGSSLWQMELAMENPFSNPEYITNFLGSLRQMSGGNRELYARSIYNVFGQYGITRNLADQLSMGELSVTDFAAEIDKMKTTPERDYQLILSETTGELAKLTAAWQGMWETSGFQNIEKIAETLNEILETIQGREKDPEKSAAKKVVTQGVQSAYTGYGYYTIPDEEVEALRAARKQRREAIDEAAAYGWENGFVGYLKARRAYVKSGALDNLQ